MSNQNNNPSRHSSPQGSPLFSPRLEDNMDNPLFKLPSIKAVWGMENAAIIENYWATNSSTQQIGLYGVNGCTSCCNTLINPQGMRNWLKNDNYMKHLLASNISTTVMMNLGQPGTSFKCWKQLLALYENKTHDTIIAYTHNLHQLWAVDGDNIIFESISLLTPTSTSLMLNSRSSYLHLYPNPGIRSQKTTLDEGLTLSRQIWRNLWLLKNLLALYMKNINGGLGVKKNQPILRFTTPIPNLLNQISHSTLVTDSTSGIHTASARTTTTLIVISSTTPHHVDFAAWRDILIRIDKRRGSPRIVGNEIQRDRRKKWRMW